MLKRLTFRYLLKIANIGKNRYIKLYQKFAVSNIRRTFVFGNVNETETEKSSLIILIAKRRTLIVPAF